MLLMLENFRDLIWGIPCAILLAVAGIYVIIQTRFFSLPHVNSTQKRRNGAGMLSQLRAISTALGGTVGIGSIIGVAYALKEGGPGSLVLDVGMRFIRHGSQVCRSLTLP